MALHGSSFPDDHGGFVVTVLCPNAFAHQRLMQAISNIVPDAGEPTPQPETREQPTPYIAGFEPNEDGVIAPVCATGSCGLD
jgi:hypothetical protein